MLQSVVLLVSFSGQSGFIIVRSPKRRSSYRLLLQRLTDDVLKHFQTDISAYPTEEVASQIGHDKLTDFVRFVQHCDPAAARQ